VVIVEGSNRGRTALDSDAAPLPWTLSDTQCLGSDTAKTGGHEMIAVTCFAEVAQRADDAAGGLEPAPPRRPRQGPAGLQRGHGGGRG
jgi:hypothetical protein